MRRPHSYWDPKDPPRPDDVGLAARNPDQPRLKVYVASGWGNREGARQFMERCQLAGFAVTYDWTAEINVLAFAAGAKAWCAEQDLAGSLAADVLVAVEPAGPTCGMWVELGAALARRREGRILFVPHASGDLAREAHAGGQAGASGGGQPFISHPLVTVVATLDEVLPTLRGIAMGARGGEF